ncbi:MAG TPA: nucleoside monophosphate kinase [Candidatus Absconditabacterales bacterium]|nr:nucleoside monophosphate kinase [Candidatus Absconditabacterales bacterium]HMT27401.1 nucleoside monophosphate kinase [Candidatus Absconditabacterales bacterium]
MHTKPLVIVLFGAPGSGKGTQAKKFAEENGFIHFSTGDFIRDQIEKQTEFGLLTKELSAQGKYVPEEIFLPAIEKELDSLFAMNKPLILDGIPRTLVQCDWLTGYLSRSDLKVSLAIELKVSNETIVKRLTSRAEKENRPDDKDLAVIQTRIRTYEEKTATVLRDFYPHIYLSIDGEKPMDEVSEVLSEVLKESII